MSHLHDIHISSDGMRQYVRNLVAAQERERVERHLADCDACLELFMAVVEGDDASGEIEYHADPVALRQLEDRVISQLASESASIPSSAQPKAAAPMPEAPQSAPSVQSDNSAAASYQQRKTARRRSWLHHPVAHYTIAASITVMLIGSGTFAGLAEKFQQLDDRTHEQPPYAAVPDWESPPEQSWSDRMIDRAGSWLDGLQAARFK